MSVTNDQSTPQRSRS